jgi:hypothetical protein
MLIRRPTLAAFAADTAHFGRSSVNWHGFSADS